MLERNAFFKGLFGASVLIGVGVTGSTAASAADCVDTDGDGWGWDGQDSCKIISDCLDFDGDGWGWNGHESCQPQSKPIYAGDSSAEWGSQDIGGTKAPLDADQPAAKTGGFQTVVIADETNNPSEWAPGCEASSSDWRLSIDATDHVCEYTPNGDGAGVTVFVLDGEVDKTHQALEGVKFAPTVDLVGHRATGTGCGPGHATQVISTLASDDLGVASGVTVAPVEITLCPDGADREAGYLSDLNAGLQHVLDNHDASPSIVNLSVAVPNDAMSQADRDALTGLITDLSNDGVLVVSAAGNASDGACNYTPANVAGGNVTVGALVRPGDTHSSYNKGPCVDVYAPSEVRGANDQTGGYMNSTGTSMSTAVVSGIAAIYWAHNPDSTAAEVIAHIKGTADHFREAGVDCGSACLEAKIVDKKTVEWNGQRTLV